MDKKQNLELFEKDNAYEISNFSVTIDQLKKIGIPANVLATEVYLRKYYGDVIFSATASDLLEEEKEKKVQKLEEDDMAIDKNYKQICEEIETSEFDKNLDEIMSEIG